MGYELRQVAIGFSATDMADELFTAFGKTAEEAVANLHESALRERFEAKQQVAALRAQLEQANNLAAGDRSERNIMQDMAMKLQAKLDAIRMVLG